MSMLTKASGVLEIIIDIPRDQAKELKKMIENAGVSSFYLGKKGLAYVTKIDTREVKK
jgi:3-hydroxyisobutyrate dehydrogenase-like beta-hydroxyacid dehydrogenase